MRLGDLDKLFNDRPEYLNPQHETNGAYNRGWNACNDYYAKLIRFSPTVDAAPVVHGRWIEKIDIIGDLYFDCSVCGESFCFIDGVPSENLYYYCPNCGAKMDGGET